MQTKEALAEKLEKIRSELNGIRKKLGEEKAFENGAGEILDFLNRNAQTT